MEFDYLVSMKFIQGQDRFQTSLFPVSLDASIDENNDVRLIDAFVESLEMKSLGFDHNFVDNGRPAYHPKDLLKLFIYGYLNKIRSSRGLEKETRRNIEMIWLLKGLSPDHNTINNFRKDNPKAIKKVFRKTVEIARDFDLIGGLLLAGDGTKLRAQNSKKNNYNQKKIDRHIKYIEEKLDEYTAELAEADGDEKQEIENKIKEQQQRKVGYIQIEKELQESGEKQISTSDPDSRQLIIRGMITEVAYNIQSTVDSEHKLPIDYEVSNENDSGAMGKMARRAKSIIRHNRFSLLFDKGYHSGIELTKVQMLGIDTHVAFPSVPKTSQAPNPIYNVENFTYDQTSDSYECPQGNTLRSNHKWYTSPNYRFKQYKTKACQTCSVKSECTLAKNGKIIQRSEYQDAVDLNKQNIVANPELYKQRQAVVEHPFGTMKRQWGFDHIMTKKTKARASADVGFIFIAYNLKRIINIVGRKQLMTYLKACLTLYLSIKSKIKHKISLPARWKQMKSKTQKVIYFICNQRFWRRSLLLQPGF
jgi:transposase